MVLRILFVALVIFAGRATSNFNSHAQTIQIAAISDLQRVFEDGFNLPEAKDTLKIFGIRGWAKSELKAKKDHS